MNLRHALQRYLPQRHHVSDQRQLRWLGARLHDPDVWHLSRRSTAGAVSIGLFVACLPVPLHMLIAAPLALLFRVNLPVAVLSVWVTNPVTTPPLLYGAYRLGAWLLDLPARRVHFAFSWEWFTETALLIWQPLLLGSVLIGLVAALAGNVLVRVLWRLHLVSRWRARRRARPAGDLR